MLEDRNQTGEWNNWNPFRNPQEDDLYTSITNKLDEIFNFNIDSLSIIQGYALGNILLILLILSKLSSGIIFVPR